MMQFQSPLVLWGVLAAASGVIALHLLSWRRPQPRWLPTARFVPAAPQRAVSRRVQPSDAGLLVLRLLALAALGLAVADPILSVRRAGIARVIVADRSRAVGSTAEVRDSVTALERGAAATRLVLFDSLPVVASEAAWRDSSGRTTRGDLDAALIVATREATALRTQFDSVELVLVSPLHAEEVTAATGPILDAYGRAVRHIAVASRPTDPPPILASRAWPDPADPAGASLRLALGVLPSWLRVAREPLTSADSAHAMRGGLLLFWPEASDVVLKDDGVLSHSGAVVGALGRSRRPVGTVVAWWSDGQPAAAQQPLGSGCLRQVAIVAPRTGDAVLQPAFQRLMRDLTVPCDWRDERPLTAAERAALMPARASGNLPVPANATSALIRRLLLLLALMALAGEWWLRRQQQRATAQLSRRSLASGTLS